MLEDLEPRARCVREVLGLGARSVLQVTSFFYSPKIKLFLQKNAKFLSVLGSAPVPPATGGFAPRSPLASVGWDPCPQNPQTAPSLRISGYAPDSSRLDTTIESMV